MVPLDIQLTWLNTLHPMWVNIFVRSFPNSKEIFGLSTHSCICDGTNTSILHFRHHFPLVRCWCHRQQDLENGIVQLQNWIMLAEYLSSHFHNFQFLSALHKYCLHFICSPYSSVWLYKILFVQIKTATFCITSLTNSSYHL
jgi:hypothetical protein